MFRIESQADATIVHVLSDVDLAGRSAFREILTLAAAQAPNRITVNLEKCPFIDSSGLGELVNSHRILGERLAIVLPPAGVVARVFAVSGLDRALHIVQDSAVKAQERSSAV